VRCPATLTLASIALLACSEGPGSHSLAIVDGTPSADHPGVVFLSNPVAVRSCTGSVISRRVVVTAKHCVMDTVATDWIVAVGDVARPPENRVDEYAVAELRMAGDPAILIQGDGEDIAVLLLADDFGYERVPWASVLPPEFGDGSNVTLRAYGDTDPSDEIVFGRRMERSAPAYDILFGTFAADVGGCNGDSGGPGLDDAGRVLGVASYADLPDCGGWTRFERLDVQATLIQQAIDDTGGVASPEPDGGPGADGGGGGDADADADADPDGGSSEEGPPAGGGGGCSCRFVR
jgi:secreted trypsin-like serine protease